MIATHRNAHGLLHRRRRNHLFRRNPDPAACHAPRPPAHVSGQWQHPHRRRPDERRSQARPAIQQGDLHFFDVIILIEQNKNKKGWASLDGTSFLNDKKRRTTLAGAGEVQVIQSSDGLFFFFFYFFFLVGPLLESFHSPAAVINT